jgi:hypothetical protein
MILNDSECPDRRGHRQDRRRRHHRSWRRLVGDAAQPGGKGTAAGLWIGGDADTIKGETGERIALLPLFP